jgi:alkaline phosphatase
MSKARRLPVAIGGLGAVVLLGIAASFAVGGQQSRTDQVRSALHGGKARNVIFFLGDGMGTQEITAARYYQVGAAGRLNVDRLPFTGFQTTWSVTPAAAPPYRPDYDPDSASTGTMWATGQKTIDERVSQGPSAAIDIPGQNLKTVLEVAQKQGKATGNVSTAEITDATPAVLDSHISLRGCQGPADAATSCKKETKDVGGLGSIAEQTVDHHVDVVLGGGRNRFTQTITGGPDAGKTVVESAQRQGYQYVTDAAGLDAVQSVKRKPLLGLFAPVNMTTEWNGPIATLGDGTPAQRCNTTNRPANEPSLAAMTKKAISLLQNDKDGFFLQVEGASIDKQDHAANACGQIGETVAFDDAIAVALEYQRWHPDTLIVVTADHAHTSQIVGEDTTGSGNPTGYSNNLITKDGQTLRITYGTAGGNPAAATPPSQQHTGSVVPIWGSGPGAAAVLGTTDHTDLFKVLQGDDGKRHW